MKILIDGAKSSCPTTGIKYLPKYSNATITTTTMSLTMSSTMTSLSTSSPSTTRRSGCKVGDSPACSL